MPRARDEQAIAYSIPTALRAVRWTERMIDYTIVRPGSGPACARKLLYRTLRLDLLHHKCRKLLHHLQVQPDSYFAALLVDALASVRFVYGSYIIRGGHPTDGMYFISSGAVEVLVGGQRAKRAREPPRAVSPLRTAKRACEPRVNFHRLLAARNGAREHDEQPAR